MKILKETFYLDYLIRVAFAVLAATMILNLFGIPILSMIGGILIGTGLVTIHKWKQLNSKELSNFSLFRKLITSLIVSVPLSQWGWIALLVK